MTARDENSPKPTPESAQKRAATDKPWFGSLRRYADNVESHDWDYIRQQVDEARARGER
jgi:hypothetical protein